MGKAKKVQKKRKTLEPASCSGYFKIHRGGGGPTKKSLGKYQCKHLETSGNLAKESDLFGGTALEKGEEVCP